MVSKIETPNDVLCRLCRDGKVFEVEDWLKAGNKPDLNPRLKVKWAMGIAIENRNHSLVEVLLRNGFPADEKTVLKAVKHRRIDMLELMVKYGADLKSISMKEVVEAGNPDVVQLFFNHGADMFKDYPFYRGLIFESKIWLSFYKKYQPQYPELQQQLDMALRKGVEKENIRIISLMLWAGANPRSEVIDPDDKHPSTLSAMEEAAFKGNIEILKLLKPDPAKDDIHHLLKYSIMCCKIDVVKYWISLGADINHQMPEGQPSLHREAMHSIGWRMDSRMRSFSYSPEHEAMRFAEEWFSLGAVWIPDGRDEKYIFHQALEHMSDHQFITFLELLLKKKVMPAKALYRLLNPKLREKIDFVFENFHYKEYSQRLLKLFQKEGVFVKKDSQEGQ